MIRGLLIRQVFVLVDLALAVLVLVTAGVVVMKFIEPAPELPPAEVDAGVDNAPMDPSLQVSGRSHYNSIVDSGLFGDAGRYDPAAAPEPEPEPEPEPTVEDTALNLQLVGTTATHPTDPLASAIIRNLDRRGQGGTYFLDHEVLEDTGQGAVKLVEVHPRAVILLNERRNPPVRERLVMGEFDGAQHARQTPQRQAPSPADGVNRVTIDRQAFTQELYENYASLVTQIRPEYYRDEDGNVVGLTADNIGSIPLAQQLSLQDGDVLQSINNEPIDSEQKVMELFQKYRNANAFRIGILRNGRPSVITYRLE